MAEEENKVAPDTTPEPARGGGNAKGKEEAKVPSFRLKQETRAKNEFKSELSKAQARIAELEKSVGDVNQVKTQWETEKSEWDVERSALRVGLSDPEALSVARHLWSALPAEGRKPFGEVLAQWKESPADAPKAIRAYFGDDAVAPPAGRPRATPATASPTATAATSLYSATELAAARKEAVRTGDWTRFHAMVKAIDGKI